MSTLTINNQVYQINLTVPLIQDGQLSENYALLHVSLGYESYFVLKNNEKYQIEPINNSSLLDQIREQNFSQRRSINRTIYKEVNENLDKIQELVGKWQEEIKNIIVEKIELNQEQFKQQREAKKNIYYDPLEKWLDSAECLKYFLYEIPGSSDTVSYGLYQSKFDNELKFITTKTGSFKTDKTLMAPEEFEANISYFQKPESQHALKKMLELYKIKDEKNRLSQFKNINVTSYEEEKLKLIDVLNNNNTLKYEDNESEFDIYNLKRYYLFFNREARSVDYNHALFIAKSREANSYWVFEKENNHTVEVNLDRLIEIKENIVRNRDIIKNNQIILDELNKIETHLIMPNIEQRNELNILKSSSKAIVSEEGKELLTWLKSDSIRSLGYMSVMSSFLVLVKEQIHILKNKDTNEIKVILSNHSEDQYTLNEIKPEGYEALIKKIEKEPLKNQNKVSQLRSVLEKIKLDANLNKPEEAIGKNKKHKI